MLYNLQVWTNDDVSGNGIRMTYLNPPFVEEYECMLGMKRRVPINVRRLLILSRFLMNE